ncbi:hypothetical protein K435DRAFT_867280 [Dendrothele bispora CBS 962.96]|uniref:Uncharacterized protein n=1 Tax=Dendrothele bispora (strain CBS 962.96) TaxID=1314807 RepID=A0A4S8LEN4_DENBC|nr:hypothetical protein K435DRAFT_867280 [Dendrothele bispora CBS 962.96]
MSPAQFDPKAMVDFDSLWPRGLFPDQWTEWSESCLDALLLVRLSEYVEGMVSKPADSATEQKAIWEHNDNEKTHICECGTSKEVWDSLKSRHRKQGNFTQISLIEEAFSICFARDATILDTMQHIFEIGIPDEQSFHQLILLNTLSMELHTMCDTLPMPVEKELKETERSNTALTNAAHTTGPRNGPRCATPGCHGIHLTKNCFAKGGPMEGKHDEVLAERKKARERREQGREQKSNTKRFIDESGKAYMLAEDMETAGSAVELTSNNELHNLLASQYEDIGDGKLSMALFELENKDL